MIKPTPKSVKFGTKDIKDSFIFYYRKYVFAFVNIKPIVPGHVLLSPIRKEKHYKDLTETEAMEMWISVKKISENLKKFYNVIEKFILRIKIDQTDSIQITIQDGEDSGQTVPHCHIHLIPVSGKLSYDEIDGNGKLDIQI